jgi:hypothetical protein
MVFTQSFNVGFENSRGHGHNFASNPGHVFLSLFNNHPYNLTLI